MKKKVLQEAWLAVVLCAAVVGITGSTAHAAKSCGDRPSLFAYNIKVKKASCNTATKVVKKWNKTNGTRIKNFRCTYRSTDFHEGKIRCRNGEKRVRWITAS